VTLCQDLLRFDTSNRDGKGNESIAAEYVAAQLADVGVQANIYAPPGAPTRTSVVCRIPGIDETAAPMLIHSHLDVVPADPAEWQVDPFGGDIVEDCLWGRGAVDMKNMVAAKLAIVREWMRSGELPARSLVLAFLADEEAGGQQGAKWLVKEKPELFKDCALAIGEVGGFSFTAPSGRRLYLIETAEKGMYWIELTTKGIAGHGSAIRKQSAAIEMVQALARVSSHTFPLRITRTVKNLLKHLHDELGFEVQLVNSDWQPIGLEAIRSLLESSLRNTANITELQVGYKVNVIPGEAKAKIDGRFLPGYKDEFIAELAELLGPDVAIKHIVLNDALEMSSESPLAGMERALKSEDAMAAAVPYLLPAGTDAKYFSKLGIDCYGFCPLRLPDRLDFFSLFHGVDERIPLDSLSFLVRVLRHYLTDPRLTNNT
jgi:acetylornithine deacetylase/succinyl-diaminopimelate desuccinylase-like protein